MCAWRLALTGRFVRSYQSESRIPPTPGEGLRSRSRFTSARPSRPPTRSCTSAAPSSDLRYEGQRLRPRLLPPPQGVPDDPCHGAAVQGEAGGFGDGGDRYVADDGGCTTPGRRCFREGKDGRCPG